MRGQPATGGDPAPHRRGIHRVQHLGRFGIGNGAAIGAEIPRRVESEHGMRGNANLVVRDRAEDDGAGRGAQAVDDHGFAGGAQALISVDVGADPAAAVIRDPNHRMTCPHARQQQQRREHPRHKSHVLPQSTCRNRI